MLGLYLSSKLNWGSYIASIAITASKKIGALILSKFTSPEVPLLPLQIYHIALHGTVMPELELLPATWKCYINY